MKYVGRVSIIKAYTHLVQTKRRFLSVDNTVTHICSRCTLPLERFFKVSAFKHKITDCWLCYCVQDWWHLPPGWHTISMFWACVWEYVCVCVSVRIWNENKCICYCSKSTAALNTINQVRCHSHSRLTGTRLRIGIFARLDVVVFSVRVYVFASEDLYTIFVCIRKEQILGPK